MNKLTIADCRLADFDGMAAARRDSLNLTGVGEPERLPARQVTANFFSVLGVQPALGRPFLPEEDQVGANAVAVLSKRLWKRRFGSDPNIIGRPDCDRSPSGQFSVLHSSRRIRVHQPEHARKAEGGA